MTKTITFIAVFLLIGFPAKLYAQDLDGYAPPPMFGAPQAVPQKELPKRPIDKLPAISKEIAPEKLKTGKTEEKLQQGSATLKPVKNNLIEKKVVKEVQKPKPTTVSTLTKIIENPPIPKAKPTSTSNVIAVDPQSAPEAIKTVNKSQTAKAEPIDFLSEDKVPEDTPAQPEEIAIPKVVAPIVTKAGVVKGPKSMPAVGKKDVEVVSTLNDDEVGSVKSPNMFERLKKEREKKKQDKQEAKEKAEQKTALIDLTINAEAPDFVNNSDLVNVLMENYILVFNKGESDLSDKHQSQILTNIAPILDSDTTLVLNINAYASPLDDVSFSDRRVALNRALGIRDFLLSQKIEPARINMRSHGFDPAKTPPDQIEMSFTQIGV